MARYRDDHNGEEQAPEYRARRFRDDNEPAEAPAKQEKPQEVLNHSAPEHHSEPPRNNGPKKKKKSTPVLIILLIIAILVFLGSGAMLVWETVIHPGMNDSNLDEIRDIATETVSSETEDGKRASVDFDSLRDVNQDIIGWINIPNTVVDYPVLQSSKEDPEYYLYRNYKKEDTKYGSIFLDAANTFTAGDNTAKSMTIYGHHMTDGRMFAEILKYGDLKYYQNAPVIYFDTFEEQADWKVISVFKTNVREDQGEIFQYVRPSFTNSADFLNFVHNVMIRSIIDTGVTVNENDQLLVLSTCSYEYEDFRTVIVARKVRTGESSNVDVTKAAYSNAPLYPDCWYWNGDSTKPTYPATFAEAQKAGQAAWYDGALKAR